MIDVPVVVAADSFQQLWAKVVRHLADASWETRNLVAHVKEPERFDDAFHSKVEGFCGREGLMRPRHVAYTIFPLEFFRKVGSSERLFKGYNKDNGLFQRLQRRYQNKSSWGTYFRRMTCFQTPKGSVNQLENIIGAIRKREKVSKAALTIVIQQPGSETTRPLGGPCLNYLAVQEENTRPTTLGLLAVYRNHDFLNRAYGNYWGLCNLLMFLAKETDSVPGPLTCISSRAYFDSKKPALRVFAGGLCFRSTSARSSCVSLRWRSPTAVN